MDRFDEFLERKALKEKENQTLPKSFEDKFEMTLNNLESNSSERKWHMNKKVLAMVAGFAFVLIVGIGGINNFGNINGKGASPKSAQDSYSINNDEAKKEMAVQDFVGEARSRTINEENSVYSITLKTLVDGSKYKNINNKEDINRIIDFINRLELAEVQTTVGVEWDFIIQINGTMNSNIIIKDNLMSVNDRVYEMINWNKNDLINLYDELNYEEKDIKYCPTN